MTCGTLTRQGPTRTRRGAMLVWFVLIAVPMLFFSISLSTEISQTLIVNRKVQFTAESAAVAGAFQFRYSGADDFSVDGRLDRGRAGSVARQTFNAGVAAGSTRGAHIVNSWPEVTDHQVRYVVQFEHTNQRVTRWLSRWLGNEQQLGVVTIRETAVVCRPGTTSGPTGGNCQRPNTNLGN